MCPGLFRFDAKTSVFDTSKIADVMDMLRYELIHHQYLMSSEAFNLASHSHNILLPVHAFACPSESGITATQKLRIAAQVVGRLVRKIVRDVTFFRYVHQRVEPSRGLPFRDLA